MSMTRNAAISHFSARKYAGMSIGESFKRAPEAVKNGLHPKDIQWIHRFGYVSAAEFVTESFSAKGRVTEISR